MAESHELCDGKIRYSQREAGEVLHSITRRQHKNHSKKIPKRAYFCRKCGCYHLTSTPNYRTFGD